MTVLLRQMKGNVRDNWKPIVIRTDQACQRMRTHQSERMNLIFGIELCRQVHAKLPQIGSVKNDV